MPPSPISPTLKSRVVEVDSLNPEDLRRFASAPLSGRFSKGVMWMTASPEVHRLLFMAAGQGLRKWLLNHLPGTVEYRRERVELKGLMDAEVLTLEEIPQQAGAVHASSSTSSAEPQRQTSGVTAGLPASALGRRRIQDRPTGYHSSVEASVVGWVEVEREFRAESARMYSPATGKAARPAPAGRA